MKNYNLDVVLNWAGYRGNIYLETIGGYIYTNGEKIIGLHAAGGNYDRASFLIEQYLGALYSKYLNKLIASNTVKKVEKLSGHSMNYNDSYIKIKNITETKAGGYLFQVTFKNKLIRAVKNV